LLEGNSKLEELQDDVAEVLEEGIVVLGVLLDEGTELLVLDKSHVGWQHHKGLRSLVLVLLRAVPLSRVPLLLKQKSVVIVGDNSWGECPWALESTSVGVATSKSVGTAESNNLLVIESHAAEDSSQMRLLLGGIWQTSIRSASRNILVLSTGSVWDNWALHFLDGTDTSKNPKVGIGNPWELLLDGLHEVSGSLQTSIGTVVTFWGKSHGSTIATTSSGCCIVGSACVPGQSHQDWTVASIIIVIFLLECLGNLVVNLLVIFGLGTEDTLSLTGRAREEGAVALGVEVVPGATSGGKGTNPEVAT